LRLHDWPAWRRFFDCHSPIKLCLLWFGAHVGIEVKTIGSRWIE
jgi:hypothetical protein